MALMITRRDWWIGIAVIVLALLVHALVPRYDWRGSDPRILTRIDRWTGHAEWYRPVQR